MTAPRLVAVMGSGETSPTMTPVHRMLLERLGDGRACLLDSPYGFQENADELTERARRYFQESVGVEMAVASLRRAGDPLDEERAAAAVRASSYVFAGPGSPSYALRVWEGGPVAAALAGKVSAGGCVAFASAAALTLGAVTVPVYEIYKVGEAPRWLPGLDLLGPVGIEAAFIPHFDNAEGGTHDTRFCYLGQSRLEQMEADLSPGTAVVGVDEHTALVLDLDAGTAEVHGRGSVTVRAGGVERARHAAGDRFDLDTLRPGVKVSEPAPAPTEPASSLAGDFDAALARRDADAATRAALAAQAEGRADLPAMIAALGDAATEGLRDPRSVIAAFVDALIEERDAARAAGRYDDADRLRDRLAAAGVEVRDTAEGTEWDLAGDGES